MTLDDVRRIALALPETEEGTSWGSVSWKVKGKLFVWERPLRKADVAALGASAPEGPIIGVKVEHEGAKRALLESEPGWAFTTPHFDGHAIVLVQLEHIGAGDLEELVLDAWLCAAPPKVADAHLAGR